MITPGDNDWTDCDRASNGSFNSLERLDHERQVFFGTSASLGTHPLQQEEQSTPDCLGVSGPVNRLGRQPGKRLAGPVMAAARELERRAGLAPAG